MWTKSLERKRDIVEVLTLCLLMLSADSLITFASSLDANQIRQNVSTPVDTLMVFLKEHFEKVYFDAVTNKIIYSRCNLSLRGVVCSC